MWGSQGNVIDGSAPHPSGRASKARGPSSFGFTLIELLLVLLIIGTLAALVVPRFAHRSEQARVVAAQVDVRANIASALDLFELDNGFYPTTAQGLEALVEEPSAAPLPMRWNGPYVKGAVPKDPWGHRYLYRCPSLRSGADYDLFSAGPDGVEGTADDITGTTQD
jgi:general secretion pathway protein G